MQDIDAIRRLEKISRLLDPLPAERDVLRKQVAAHSEWYLQNNEDGPVYYTPDPDDPGLLASPIGETGLSMDETLDLLRDHVDRSGLNPTSGRFMGYIPGGALFHSALGDYLAAITNRYSGFVFANPGAVQMENQLIAWMAGVVGYPESSAGNLASGGSIATLTALVTARDAHGIEGNEIPRSVIYLTDQLHHCFRKALHIAGLKRVVVRTIDLDENLHMRADALEQTIRVDKQNGLNPWLVVASAGTTNTGAVDPLAAIGDIASTYGLWYHIDAAYGGFFNLCPEGQEVLKGLEASDSLILDPHKTLFLPYGTGAVLVKDRRQLYESHRLYADYMESLLPEDMELSPADVSPELTKHFRGLRMWLPLKLLGLAPFRAALSEKIYLARYFHERIAELPGFETGPYPDLSVATFRYVPRQGDADAFNQKLRESLQRDGRVFFSGTRFAGRYVLRAAISCFRTHLDDVEEAIEVVREAVKRR